MMSLDSFSEFERQVAPEGFIVFSHLLSCSLIYIRSPTLYSVVNALLLSPYFVIRINR
jgi:hypothetical protein